MQTIYRTTTTAILLVGLLAPLAQAGSREVAAERFKRAQTLLEDLRNVPELELGKAQYELVIRAFKEVHRANPSSGYCDDALLAAADVRGLMVERFGPEYADEAIADYQFLIREYPHSKLLDDAREALARLQRGEAQPIQLTRAEPVDDPPAEAAPVAAEPPVVSRAAPQPEPTPAAPPARAETPRVVEASTRATSSQAQPTPEKLSSADARIRDLRYWSDPDSTRIQVELDDYAPYKFEFLSNPRRLYFDLFRSRLSGDVVRGVSYELGDKVVERIRLGQNRVNKARLVLDLKDDVIYNVSWLENPPRLLIELRGKTVVRETLARAPEPEPAPAEPEAEESRFEQVETVAEAAPLPAEAQAVAGRVEPEQPKSFAEAFYALTNRRQRAETTAVRSRPAPPPTPVRYETVARREAAPAEQAIGSVGGAPEVRADEATADERLLAKLEPPPAPPVAERNREPKRDPIDLSPPKAADATSSGVQNLTRALGLKVGRVVIDAGHGGHDTGSIGPSGLLEKDLVLDVSMRLGKLVAERLGAEVIYTRQDDTFVDLDKRPAVANRSKADLFVSVHANSYRQASVRGVETYYLNFTTDEWALKVASRENAASNHSVHELQDLLGKIAMREKIDESREFAARMQGALFSGLSETTKGLRDRGVRQAPLAVLIGAKMPAILAEVGFLSNPTDEKLLKSSKYRQQVAEFLYRGIESYVGSLSSHQLTMGGGAQASAEMD